MTDPRLWPSNGRVAADELEGKATADRFVQGDDRRIARPVADLHCASTGGMLDRQLLYGDRFRVLDVQDGRAFGQAERGGYVGYVDASAVGDGPDPTHEVCVRATLGFSAPDIKQPAPLRLSLGARVTCVAAADGFAQTDAGLFIPDGHLRPLSAPETDMVAVAERLLGTPYLWGGNSADGIDCSGLVQAALRACGTDCPGDSDQQRAAFTPVSRARRGDLLFWQGHVAICVDSRTLIHANAHHMAVSYERRSDCVARIRASEGKDVLCIARPTLETA
ncbi:C40 family peptidase [Pseudaestuariivita atlantica]|uniref:NlpC/P60 domain-containing protein n=1 Tax=Pseudaestuariivita atlantica TaxID=1317121 RepID=A0A0L1JNL6_9RHOB|nr:C40 family peptidase [Pseudaestuariivita atlantica]KNG93312.1 hypothetical protein ATO11_12765 [Pseudaestuariivita atlantica]